MVSHDCGRAVPDKGDTLHSDGQAPAPMTLDSREADNVRLCKVLQWWLQSPQSLSFREPDGFVQVVTIMAACPTIQRISKGDPEALIRAVHANTDCMVVCDDHCTKIGLLGLWAQVCAVAEIHVAQSPGGIVSAFELMKQPAIERLLRPLPDYSGRLRTLCEALRRSKFLHMEGVSACMQAPSSSMQHSVEERQMMDHCDVRPKPMKEKIYSEVVQLLRKAVASNCHAMESDGFVSISSLFQTSAYLAEKCFHKPQSLLRAVATSEQRQLIVDDARQTVRLSTFSEEVCMLSEDYFAQLSWYEPIAAPIAMPLDQLALVPAIRNALALSPHADIEAQLFNSLQSSELVEVWRAGGGEMWVSRRAPTQVLCRAAEDLLDHIPKFVAMRSREGVVPLSCIIEHSKMLRSLNRVSPNMNNEDALEMLSAAISHGSQRYELDGCGPRASVRERHPVCSPMAATTCPSESVMDSASPPDSNSICESGWVTPEAHEYTFEPSKERFCNTIHMLNLDEIGVTGRLQLPAFLPAISRDPCKFGNKRYVEHPVPSQVPSEHVHKDRFARDVKAARQLLTFYFQPFNIQHNRFLLSALEAQCCLESIRSPSAPWIKVEDLKALPRLSKVFEGYRKTLIPLLRAALEEDTNGEYTAHPCVVPMPVRLVRFHHELFLELTYLPDLRSIVESPLGASQCSRSKALRSSLQTLLDFEVGPHTSSQPPPANVFLAISFSVSSDLSNSNSPKTEDLQNAVYEGILDPSILSWDSRSKQLKRQLQYYGADIVCLQGLQSIGFESHNSECEHTGSWFSLNHEPDANHLVHLYRELNKLNYGVVYAPTLKVPQSQSRCLGNAVFWKTSRWKLESYFEVEGNAVCAVLTSRHVGGPRILACSGKSAASYAKDWADDALTELELLLPLHNLVRRINEQVGIAQAQPLLCGDFGVALEPSESFDLGMKSAYAEALGTEPWTSASKYSSGEVTDYIFHGGALETLAVLGGRYGPPDAVELLKCGYPSDHLLLLAAIADCSALDAEDCEINASENMRGKGEVGSKGAATDRGGKGKKAKRQGKAMDAEDADMDLRENIRGKVEVSSKGAATDKGGKGKKAQRQGKALDAEDCDMDLRENIRGRVEVGSKGAATDKGGKGKKAQRQGKESCKPHAAVECKHVSPPPGYAARPCPRCKRGQ